MAKALEEDKKREAAEKRARREENEKRRDENARKNEVVQQVKKGTQLPFLPNIFACMEIAWKAIVNFCLIVNLYLNSF